MIKNEEISLALQKEKILKKHQGLIDTLSELQATAAKANKTLYRKSDPSLEVLCTPEQIQQQYEQIISILNEEHKALSDSLAQIMDDDPKGIQKILGAIKETIGFRYRTGHKMSKYADLERTFCIYHGDDKQYKIAVTFGSKNYSGSKYKYNNNKKESGAYKQVRTGTSIIFSSLQFEHVAKISMRGLHLEDFISETKILEKIPKEICPFRFSKNPGTFFMRDRKGSQEGQEITFFSPEAKCDLYHQLTVRGLTSEGRAYIFAKLLQDLCKLHAGSISHRDIKLENIFIGYNDIPYFGDYGLSGDDGNSAFCTLDYSSPRIYCIFKKSIEDAIERQATKPNGQEIKQKFNKYFEYINDNEILSLSGNPFADDIWAIGVMYYLCLEGRDPKDDIDYFEATIKKDVFLSAVLSIKEAQRSNANQALLLLTAQYLVNDNSNDNTLEEFLLDNFGGREKLSTELRNEIKRIDQSNDNTELGLQKKIICGDALSKINASDYSASKKMR